MAAKVLNSERSYPLPNSRILLHLRRRSVEMKTEKLPNFLPPLSVPSHSWTFCQNAGKRPIANALCLSGKKTGLLVSKPPCITSGSGKLRATSQLSTRAKEELQPRNKNFNLFSCSVQPLEFEAQKSEGGSLFTSARLRPSQRTRDDPWWDAMS